MEVEVVMVVIYDMVLVVVGMLGEGDWWVFFSLGIWLLLGIELNVLENGL